MNYSVHKKDIYPRSNAVSKLFTCQYEGCSFAFRRANKKYCPEHFDMMRRQRNIDFSRRQNGA